MGRKTVVHRFRIDVNAHVIAEVELVDAEEPIDVPEWIGKEVSADPRYFNANLVSRPYSSW